MMPLTVTDLKISDPSNDDFMGNPTPDGYHWYRSTCRVNGEKYSIMAMISDELVNGDYSFINRFFLKHAVDEYKEDHTA